MPAPSERDIIQRGRKDKGTIIKGHALDLGAVMVRDAVVQEDKTIVWEGSVTGVLKELEIPQGYYTLIMRQLYLTDCIRQLRAGARSLPSQYLILRDPASLAEHDWPSVNSIVKSTQKGLTATPARYKILTDRVDDIENRLGGLNVATAFAELQQQINELKRQVDNISQKG